MRTSPRRPLILKRRKLALPGDDAAASQHSATKDETDGTGKAVPSGQQPNDPAAHPQKFPTGIKIVNHPTMPNTQVVFIPKHANIQSIIAALTAKGKECGSTGPNKFILISGGGSLRPAWSQGPHVQVDRDLSVGEGDILRTGVEGCKSVAQDQDAVEMEDDMLLQTVKHLAPRAHPKYEEDSNSGGSANCALDESLTNIQWLGKMSSDVLGSCSVREELEDKENHPPEPEGPRTEEEVSTLPCSSSFTTWQESISERPPYSYMAMIQFAINSTDRKRMTLKEIYTWIEEHFPYFKHIAKPGWKNSIRHNLSLHDMFVRETSANGKVSFWTIHPDANRCLTLDQVFKQQKRLLPELQKVTPGCSGMKSEGPGGSGTTERKMKLLLPRVNSYFVPVHFPQNQQFLQQPVGKTSLSSAPVSTADQAKSNKRVQIVPKATVHGGNGSPFLPIQSSLEIPIAKSEELPSAVIKEEEEDENPFSCSKEKISYTALKSPAWKMPDMQSSMLDGGPTHILLQSSVKEETTTALKDCRFEVLREDVPLAAWKEEKALPAVKSPVRRLSDSQVIRRRKSSSRRKQHLSIPCAEEPLIVFPDCSNSDSGLVSDFSFLQDTHPLEPSTDLNCTQETFAFKTPIKEKSVKHPASSTPSKPVGTVATTGGSEQWRLPPLNKEGSLPDFSPVRLPQGTALTPFKDSLDLLGFSSPPFHDLPLFDSPQQLLNNKSPDIPSGPFTSSPTLAPHAPKRCSKELPIGGSTNRSLTEGLVLDTMNDSLSKILLDISFTGLEDDDDFEGDNVSWSHLIPELR
ncbi:forkhead box protein M1 isoform X2 [Ambystoma mexicanum]|uniref:forkhead box protein M1 isoform X2 n=1 Tax=Ambystoma mexicanum TaxID=8296 RepID=UPI0037E72F0E